MHEEHANPTDDYEEREVLLNYCTEATLTDYEAWLTGYCDRGGTPTHRYDSPFPSASPPGRWSVLETVPPLIPPLYGARAVHIIVPASLAFTHSNVPPDIGHNTIRFMQDFTVIGRRKWAPVYANMKAYNPAPQ